MSFLPNLDVSNRNYTQVEPLITVQKLREIYLFGVKAIDDVGDQLSDEAVQTFINTAISTIEADLDIAVLPRNVEEHKDYFLNDYYEWGYMALNKFPVISITSIELVYMQDDNGNPTASVTIPKSWIRLDPATGIVRLVPNGSFPAGLQVGAGGVFYPEVLQRYKTVPSMWVLKYQHGFATGCVPALLNTAIGLVAANYFLNIAGDLILGSAGVASQSLSLDGLSQSIQTTASAENNGFSARSKDNNRLLYGDKTLGTTGLMDALRRYYKGSQIAII